MKRRKNKGTTTSSDVIEPTITLHRKQESATASRASKSDEKSYGKKKIKVQSTSPDFFEPASVPHMKEKPASASMEEKGSTIESDKEIGPASTSRWKKVIAIESGVIAAPSSTSRVIEKSDVLKKPTSTSREKRESTIVSDKEAVPASTSHVKEESDVIKKPASTSREKRESTIVSDKKAVPASTSRVKEESDVIKKPSSTSREKSESTIVSDKEAVPASTSRVKEESDVIKKPASTSYKKKDIAIKSGVEEVVPSPLNSWKVADQIVYLKELISKMVEGWPKEFFVYKLDCLTHDRDKAFKMLKIRTPCEKIVEQLALLREIDAPWVKKEIAWMYNQLAKEFAFESDLDVMAFKWKAMKLNPEEVADMLAIKHTKSLSSLGHSADQWLYYTKLLEGEKSELAIPTDEVWPLLFGKMEAQEVKHFFRNVKDPDRQRLVEQMILNQESMQKSK